MVKADFIMLHTSSCYANSHCCVTLLGPGRLSGQKMSFIVLEKQVSSAAESYYFHSSQQSKTSIE